MRRVVVSIIAALVLMLGAEKTYSQAFPGKGGTILMAGVGGSYYFAFNNVSAGRHLGIGAPNFSMEFGIHQYVGLGFWVSANHDFFYPFSNAYAIATPIMFRADFHFYQLIDDKSSSDIHADQLDIYAGLAVGGGPAFFVRPSGGGLYGVLGVGPHAGIRWYPGAGNVGMYAEISPYIGKSFLEGGFVAKF